MGGSQKTDGQILTKPKIDLTGKKFGKLTVIEQGPDLLYSNTRRSAWYCKCDCGNPEKVLICSDSLRGGHTKSCGKCIFADVYSKNNVYDLSGEYGVCTMRDGNTFIFDLEDYDKIKQFTWHLSGREYIGTTINYESNSNKPKETLMIHRLIMGVQDISWKECVVDHINGNVYDNRKCNLRVVSQFQNSMNQKKSKNNTSGNTGVSKYKDKWGASIKVNSQKIFLGLYEKYEDAVKTRKEAEEKYFGEYSYDNSRKISDLKDVV